MIIVIPSYNICGEAVDKRAESSAGAVGDLVNDRSQAFAYVQRDGCAKAGQKPFNYGTDLMLRMVSPISSL